MATYSGKTEDSIKDKDISCRGIFSEDYCAALDNSNVPIYIIDPENHELLYCNRTLRKNYGSDPAGRICYREFMNLDEPCPGCVALQSAIEGESKPMEIYFPMGFWGLLHSSGLNWNGRSLVQVTCVDITERKEAEAELRLRNKEYAAVVRQSTSGIMRYDIDSGTAVVNVDMGLNRVEEHAIPNYVDVICESGMIEEDSIPAARAMYDDIRKGVPSKGYDLQLFPKEGGNALVPS